MELFCPESFTWSELLAGWPKTLGMELTLPARSETSPSSLSLCRGKCTCSQSTAVWFWAVLVTKPFIKAKLNLPLYVLYPVSQVPRFQGRKICLLPFLWNFSLSDLKKKKTLNSSFSGLTPPIFSLVTSTTWCLCSQPSKLCPPNHRTQKRTYCASGTNENNLHILNHLFLTRTIPWGRVNCPFVVFVCLFWGLVVLSAGSRDDMGVWNGTQAIRNKASIRPAVLFAAPDH